MPAVQPVSIVSPVWSSTQAKHAGAVGSPLQTPAVHIEPAAVGVLEHTAATHVSVVHSLPSSQSASTPQPVQAGVPPTSSHVGEPVVQPESVAVPAASSTHGTQAGEAAPSQTPPLHIVPAMIGVAPQTPAVHMSAVHSLPSSQSASTTHSAQIGAAPDVSQTGTPAVQPVSIIVPAASSTQATHIALAPLHTPPAHMVPAMRGVLPQTPATHASVVQSLVSSQSPSVMQPTQTGETPVVSQSGAAAPQPVSVPPAVSSRQVTQIGVVEVSQTGSTAVQPESTIEPVASSTQAMHIGVVGSPSQLPPAHIVPAGSAVKTQALETQVSAVQSFESSQWASVMHSTQVDVPPPTRH